jgi:hypothetical protein
MVCMFEDETESDVSSREMAVEERDISNCRIGLTALGQRRQRPAGRGPRARRELRGALSRHGGIGDHLDVCKVV